MSDAKLSSRRRAEEWADHSAKRLETLFKPDFQRSESLAAKCRPGPSLTDECARKVAVRSRNF